MTNSIALERISAKPKALRKTTRGLNLQQMAQQTGLSTFLFSRIENTQIMPSIQTVVPENLCENRCLSELPENIENWM